LGDGAKESVAADKALSSSPGHHQSADAGDYDEDLHDDEETGLTSRDRRRKRQKRRRNTLLDQRIVREKITLAEKKEADQDVVKKLLINGSLILLWYLFSLCISLVRHPLSRSACVVIC
jgi:solute carrier family 35 protein C2